MPAYDAAHLPDGRTLVALGEAGVVALARDGRVQAFFDPPAEQLVVSDQGYRALALARRGDAWQIARLDLIGGGGKPWCEARCECFARTFDGLTWVVADGPELRVVDASSAGPAFRTLRSFELGDASTRVVSIARSKVACTAIALPRRGNRATPLCRSYLLPSWTPRPQGSACDLGGSAETICAASADAAGDVALLTGWWCHAGYATVEHYTLRVFPEGGAPLVAPLQAYESTMPLDLQLRAGTVAGAFGVNKTDDGRNEQLYIAVPLFDPRTGERRSEIRLHMRRDPALKPTVSLRLGDRTLTIADTLGRVVVVETGGGRVLVNARAGR